MAITGFSTNDAVFCLNELAGKHTHCETVDARGITLYKDVARTVRPEEIHGSVERDIRDDAAVKRADARRVRQFGAYDRFTRRPIPGIYAPVEITCGKQSAHENYVRPWKPLR